METHHTEINPVVETLNDLFAGTIGGVAQVLTGQPFDIVKVRMQRQSLTNPIYKSTMDGVRSIIANEGPKAFYKGTLSPLTGIGACTALQFAGNGISKRIVEDYNKQKGSKIPEKLTTPQYMFGGAFGGILNTVVASPVEHIRIVMQSQTNSKNTKGKYTGSYDAVIKIYKQYGLKAIYRGLNMTLFRDTIAYANWFGGYETLKAATNNPEKPHSIPMLMLFGAIAGEGFWIFTYPIDVCKTKIQSDSFEKPKYKGIVDVFSQTYKVEGFRGFWKGIVPGMMRTPISSGATFGAYEITMRYIKRLSSSE